jgi:penicillin-binding protein 2
VREAATLCERRFTPPAEQLYGKPGTAQNPHGPDHGWFAGFAGPPGRPPEIVVVAFVGHGQERQRRGAGKACGFYLDHKYGIPFDPTPTLLERLRAGRRPQVQ